MVLKKNIILLKNENEKLKKELAEKDHAVYEQINGLKKQNVNLEKENQALKEKLAKMEAYMKELKSSIRRRGLPVELINELFSSIPSKNAFGLLAKMPNGLLARNVQKLINGIKETMKNNKLNERDCGSNLAISEDGLVAKYSHPYGVNCIRAALPIPSLKMSFYYEVQILDKIINWDFGIVMGFCDKQFPMEGKRLGTGNTNSIGIDQKGGIWIGGIWSRFFGNAWEYFNKGDIVGIGIIHLPNSLIKCFFTLNGHLLGKVKLPPKFHDLQLFPAVSLSTTSHSIRVNFGKEEWQFKEFGRVLK